MPRVPFDTLPDHGRLWVFPLSRTLSDAETAQCIKVVDEFLDTWAAHGMPLRSGRTFQDDRFLLVGVDVDAEAPSGCSIDSLVNRLRALGSEVGASFIDHAPVWYRSEGEVRSVTRPQFKALATGGEVDPSTTVFDTSLTRIGAYREGALEGPAENSWHGRAFFGTRTGTAAT